MKHLAENRSSYNFKTKKSPGRVSFADRIFNLNDLFCKHCTENIQYKVQTADWVHKMQTEQKNMQKSNFE